jgi:hypothetical protein
LNNKPIAWHYPDGKPDQCTTDKEYAEKDPAWTPMYYKHAWVGLTDEEMLDCLKAVDVCTAVNLLMGQYEMPPTFKVYAEAIGAKLKEKNE